MANLGPIIPPDSWLNHNESFARVRSILLLLGIQAVVLLVLLLPGLNPLGNAVPPRAQLSPRPQKAARSTPMSHGISGMPAYKVMSGDTLCRVAARFQVSPKAIINANPNLQPSQLKVGQVILLPASGTNASLGPRLSSED